MGKALFVLKKTSGGNGNLCFFFAGFFGDDVNKIPQSKLCGIF
jgi:hypothetical protein